MFLYYHMEVIFQHIQIFSFLFFVVFLLLTLLEYLGGVIIEIVFHKVFWDYSNQKFSFGPYISLGMSLLWGFFSILFAYFLLPLEEKIIKKIPKWIIILVFFLFFVDCILTYLFH